MNCILYTRIQNDGMCASFSLQVDGEVATTHESDVHDHIHRVLLTPSITQ